MTTKPDWKEILREGLERRQTARSAASRTRWRDLVRYVLAKLRAERRLQQPEAGARLQHSVGRAVAEAKLLEVVPR